MTVVVPTGKNEPDDGLQGIGSLSQLLPDLVGLYVAVAPHWAEAAFLVILAGQVTTHVVELVTVTVKPQLGPELGVVQLTLVVPTGKLEPEGGVQVAATLEQVDGVAYSTIAEPEPGESSGTLILDGQVSVPGS